jgi:hypothetical protein
MMRYLLCSLAILLFSCRSQYKGLQPMVVKESCSGKFDKEFKTSWYNTSIDVYGKHLSGLLLIKDTGEGYRTVFTNEAGVTFFDFSFGVDGSFKVVKVIKQLDRKPVINTLRDDFALMLRLPFRNQVLESYTIGEEIFLASAQKSGTAYFITDMECASLRRLEWGSKGKRKVSILVSGAYDQPAALEIRHHTFDMVINLKKIEKE